MIHSTNHLERVAFDAALKGSIEVTNKEEEVRLDFILSRYHLRALTGHQTLSSDTDEKEEREGRKISTEGEDKD